MDTTLVTVTLLSLAMASSLSVLVWRMLRDDRRRSEARVRALTELAARAERRIESRPVAAAPPAPVRPRAVERRATLDLPLNTPAAAARPIEARPESSRVAAAPLFATPEPSSPWATRAAIAAGIVLAAAAVVLFTLAARNESGSVSSVPRGPVVRASEGTLDLLSLHDAREADALTVSGLVQNPRDGVPLTRVVVNAYTFDKDGAPLASAHGFLDASSLAPGEQSRFSVSVPATDAVARYRIGFQTEDGRVISHIDRRPQGTVAANW